MSDPVSMRILADYLVDRRDAIVVDWLGRVRQEPRLQTADNLPGEQLLDHMPILLDEFFEHLRDAGPDSGQRGPGSRGPRPRRRALEAAISPG